jgi:hypothetical protein
MINSAHIYMTQYARNWYIHIHKAVCEHEDITVLWNEGVHTDTEVLVMASRLDITIKKRQIKFVY